MLSIGKSRFFALVKEHRKDPEAFSIAYERHAPGRLPAAVEAAIERELLREKVIVEDKRLPISGYNYSALRDRLEQFSGFGSFGRHSSLLAVAGARVLVYTGGGVQIVVL